MIQPVGWFFVHPKIRKKIKNQPRLKILPQNKIWPVYLIY